MACCTCAAAARAGAVLGSTQQQAAALLGRPLGSGPAARRPLGRSHLPPAPRPFCCRRNFLQLLELPASGPLRLEYDPEWLAVLRGTHHLMNLQRRPRSLPAFGGSRQGAREADLRAVREALEARGAWLCRRRRPLALRTLLARGWLQRAGNPGALLLPPHRAHPARGRPGPDPLLPAPPPAGGPAVPDNFSPTAPAYDPQGSRRGAMPPAPLRNPQTVALLALLGLDYNLDHAQQGQGGARQGQGQGRSAFAAAAAASGGGLAAAAANPEEIDIGDEDEEAEGQAQGLGGGAAAAAGFSLANPEEIDLGDEDEEEEGGQGGGADDTVEDEEGEGEDPMFAATEIQPALRQ
jgi:hypothetical protein